MRFALVLVAVLGCAKSGEKSAGQAPDPATPVGGAAATTPTAPPPPAGGSAPAPIEQDRLRAKDQEKGGGAAGGEGAAQNTGAANGSALDEARASGVLGPSDQRAFQTNGKVTIKKFDSKDLDAVVKGKLEALQTCYDKALQFQDTLAGELTIAVKDGKATLGKSTLKHTDLEKCVIDALAGTTLPKKASLVLAFKRS